MEVFDKVAYDKELEELNNMNAVTQLAFMIALRLKPEAGTVPSVQFLSSTEIETVEKQGEMPMNYTTRYIMPIDTDILTALGYVMNTLKEDYEKALMYEMELPEEHRNMAQMGGHVYACAKRAYDTLYAQK